MQIRRVPRQHTGIVEHAQKIRILLRQADFRSLRQADKTMRAWRYFLRYLHHRSLECFLKCEVTEEDNIQVPSRAEHVLRRLQIIIRLLQPFSRCM